MGVKSSAEEMRKLQITGGSTYIVSLPKGWVEKMGLERGSTVSIRQLDDLTLCIQPKGVKVEDKVRRAVITIADSNKISPESLIRRLVSAYLVGYNIIQIRNLDRRIETSQRYAVKDFTRKKLVGTEILSDLPRELILQVLLSHTELSVNDALRRMSIIAVSMHQDALITLGMDDTQLAREIITMDDEVDRFSLYIIRLLKAAVSDSRILREIGLRSSRECLGYRLITKSVERMADHAVNIARNSLTLTMSNLNEEILNELKNMSESAVKVFEDAVDALFNGDYASADGVFNMAYDTRAMEAGAIQKIIKNASPEDVPALRLVIESIMRTAEYGSDIAETVLNMTIKTEIQEA